MESLFPGLLAAAALSLTYLTCIRPMRRGRSDLRRRQPGTERAADLDTLRVEIAELRRDLESLPGA